MTRILIVDDDSMVSSFLQQGFRAHGYAAAVVDDGDRAARLIEHHQFDLVILDLALPGREGTDLLRYLRARGQPLPVIVLTGRSDLRDAAACLNVGADDYLTKPFRFDELLARVRARMRPDPVPEPSVIAVAGVRLDISARRAGVGDRIVDLTAREFALLEFLMRNPGQVLSRTEILQRVWGRSIEPGSNVVNVYINSLRRKLGATAIESIRGIGYRFRD